jgi:hypothetical protein
LNKIVYILLILIGINFTSFGQNKIATIDPASAAKMIRFYPNPASSVITFEFLRANDNSYTLQVFNFMGKKVYDIKKTPTRITINLDDFFRGIYIFQLRDKNGSIVQSGKFQVVK